MPDRIRPQFGAWWSEFGAARWGGGAVDALGVGRERWRGQPPDNGASVGGHGGYDLFDALGIALIHQHPEHEWEVVRVDGTRFVLQELFPLGGRDVLLH